MPLSFDEWLEATYADQPEDEDSPVPASAIETETPDFEAPAYDQTTAELENMVPQEGVSPVPEGTGQEIEFTPQEAEAEAAADGFRPQAVSGSASYSGYNLSDDKTKQIARAGSVLDERVAAEAPGIVQEGEETAQALGDIRDRQMDNIQSRFSVEEKVAMEREKINQEEADLMREQIFQEKLGYHQARLAEEAAMNNYMAAVQAYSASNINPGKLWEDMGGAHRFNTAVAVFSHNFLNTRGVPTGTMDALNRALDINIDAQVRNLEKKGRTVGHFGQVWDMVRAQSESDAEARLKMRGLQLAEFKAAAVARLSSFDSDFARLKAQELSTSLDQEFVKTLDQIRQRTRTNLDQMRDYNLRRWTAEQQLRMESARIGLARRELELKEGAGEELTSPELLVANPETGEVIGAVGDKEARKEVQAKLDTVVDGASRVRRIAELQRELDKVYDGKGAKLFTNKYKDELRSLLSEGEFEKAVALTGLTATDQQLERIRQIRGTIDNWTKGVFSDNDGTLIHVASQELLRDFRKMETKVRSNVYDVSPQTKARYQRITPPDLTSRSIPLAEREGPPASNKTIERIGEISGPGSWEPRDATDEYINYYVEKRGYNPYEEKSSTSRKNFRGETVDITTTSKAQLPQWAVAMQDVAETVKNKSVSMKERAQAAAYIHDQVEAYLDKSNKPKMPRMGDWEVKGAHAVSLYEDLFNDGWIDVYGNVKEGRESIEGADPVTEPEGY